MFKVSLFSMFALLFCGCASSSSNPSLSVKTTKTTKLIKYASNQGCKMLSTGYMVCPK